MPKIYTKREREHALYIVEQLDDYDAASEMVNIPAQTLRNWWSAYKTKGMFSPYLPNKMPDAAYTTTAESAPTPAQIRDSLIRQIDVLMADPTTDPRKAYYTALAIRALLDQIKSINRDLDITPP